ncbi:MIZ/SP-RING zinc finger family protein [Leishmania donovani]|uniref:MIZ/SP-RING zinc finger family protein n=1 Tax=Leishmania donovani TaxID=5661 RepID=A0A504XAL6_LEIDO|nr:MIZ/SP-RING zinc finger family protein [Leishmania donovani]
MQYPPDTQVWVKCDDGVWWPGTLRETDTEMQAFLCAGEDCCVEFYHSPGELYPLFSADKAHVRPLHAEPHTRTPEEDAWFANETVAEAAAKALRDYQCCRLLNSPPDGPPAGPAPISERENTRDALPFTATELRNIESLLGAVGNSTAARLRQELQQARASVASRGLRRQDAPRRQARKRQRPAEPPPSPAPPAATHRSGCEALFWQVFLASVCRRRRGGDASEEDEDAVPFVQAARRHVLEVLRHEVFENPSRFVLSPVYHFVDMLGAVVVENSNLTTTLPAPRTLHERPAEGFSPQRRVLLVPLTDTYEHTTGWMLPTEIEGAQLAMSLYVDDTPVSLPPNWQLSPAKEAAAVKTAITVDITPLVLPIERDLFSLQVIFSGDVAEMEMWRGVIACVLVEEVGLAHLGERIVSTYHKRRAAAIRQSPSSSCGERGAVAITEASVKIQCPMTTLTMEIPVRGMYCEHLQCMELAAVLIQCARQNVWNCPLCSAAMKPEDIIVNYRLKDWIASHSQEVVAQVEYVVETEPGRPLKIVYKAARPEQHSTIEVIDDEEG